MISFLSQQNKKERKKIAPPPYCTHECTPSHERSTDHIQQARLLKGNQRNDSFLLVLSVLAFPSKKKNSSSALLHA